MPVQIVTDEEVRKALPPLGFIREYVESAANWSDAPLAYHLASALAVSAAVLPTRLHIYAGSIVRPNLYCMIVGDSVLARKSSSMDIGLRLLRAIEDGALVGDTPGSAEGLMQSLQDKPRQLIEEPEFSRFLSQAYGRSYLNPVKALYTDVYDGRPFNRRTVNRVYEVPETSLSVLAGIAPEYLERYLEPHDLTSGFFARWYFINAARSRWVFMPSRDLQQEQGLIQKLQKIRKLTPEGKAMLDPEAYAYMEPWARAADEKARSLSGDDPKRGVCGRMQTLVAKLALIVGALRHIESLPDDHTPPDPLDPPDLTINKEDVEHAISLAYLHGRSANSITSNLAMNSSMYLRRKILKIIEQNTPCALGAILRQANLLKKEAAPILETLEEEGLVCKSAAAGGLQYRMRPEDSNPGEFLPPTQQPLLISNMEEGDEMNEFASNTSYEDSDLD